MSERTNPAIAQLGTICPSNRTSSDGHADRAAGVERGDRRQHPLSDPSEPAGAERGARRARPALAGEREVDRGNSLCDERALLGDGEREGEMCELAEQVRRGGVDADSGWRAPTRACCAGARARSGCLSPTGRSAAARDGWRRRHRARSPRRPAVAGGRRAAARRRPPAHRSPMRARSGGRAPRHRARARAPSASRCRTCRRRPGSSRGAMTTTEPSPVAEPARVATTFSSTFCPCPVWAAN